LAEGKLGDGGKAPANLGDMFLAEVRVRQYGRIHTPGFIEGGKTKKDVPHSGCTTILPFALSIDIDVHVMIWAQSLN